MDNIIFVLDTTQPEMSPETNLQIYTIMEYASVFTTIVNLYALYVIWYKTPMHMKKYGRSLAAYQFVSLLMDVMLCSATVPYLIFPVPGGYPLGWMSHVGISTQLQLVLVGLVGTEMGVVMITLFMTRQQAIMPDSHPLKWSSRTGHALFIAGHLVLYLHISGMLLYMLTHDDQSAAKKIYQEKYPFFRRFFDIESLYVFDPVIGGIIIVNLVVLFFVFLAMILAASTTSFIGLASQKQFMSAKTYKLQQQWIYNCVIQVTLPLTTLGFPIVFDGWIYYADAVAFVGFLPIIIGIAGLHGFCTTLVTMFIYRPYSEYIKKSAMGVLEFFAPDGNCGRSASSPNRSTSAALKRPFTATTSNTINSPLNRR